MKNLTPVKATLLDDDHLRLLAFPFHGPIPSPRWPGGVDLDGETFTPRTDIKAAWLPWRPVDWHHGNDPSGVMGREVVGKADNLEMDEEGWWVDLWLDAGNRRLDLIRRLAERGGRIFGSSEPLRGTTKVNKSGEIEVWPYWRQTLSTSPQNTHSRIEPVKAALDEAVAGGYPPTEAFWNDLQDALTDLDADLLTGAKAGRVDGRRLSELLSDTSVQVERLVALASSRALSGDRHGGDATD
jgi:hypothetical protein